MPRALRLRFDGARSAAMVKRSASVLAAPDWLRTYSRGEFRSDLLASAIVTVMLIPQFLAYALLAGLPPEAGLYASMFPAVAYACFGSSRTLAVGPVAVISLMTATALADATASHDIAWSTAAALLAVLSGIFLFLLGLLRTGWIANFLSHAVISGFISASALYIALGQLPHVFGIDVAGDTLFTLLPALIMLCPWSRGSVAGPSLSSSSPARVLLRCLSVSGSLKTLRSSPFAPVRCSQWRRPRALSLRWIFPPRASA